jgi:hypothetical protein
MGLAASRVHEIRWNIQNPMEGKWLFHDHFVRDHLSEFTGVAI